MMSRYTPAAALAALMLALASSASVAAPVAPTKPIELARYFGLWHEIARIPNNFERGAACSAPTADYRQDGAGKISVVQTCHVGSPNGPDKIYKASGRILDPGVNARLKLTYYLVFSKEYWILDHATDYGWAIVGDQSGRFLWVMSRTPTIAPAVREDLLARAKALGYDTSRLEFPAQK